MKTLIDRLPKDAEGKVNPSELSAQDWAFTYELAGSHAGFEILQAQADQWARSFDMAEPQRKALSGLIEAAEESGNLSLAAQLAQSALENAVQAKLDAGRTEIREEERKAAREFFEAEAKARDIEGKPAVESAPSTPVGTPAGSTTGPSPTEYASATPAQRREWRKQGVSPAV
jgi:hypothetical protein